MNGIALSSILVLAIAGGGGLHTRGATTHPQATTAISANNQQSNQFVTQARHALDTLSTKMQTLEARNSNLQGQSAGDWVEARQEMMRLRQDLQNDLGGLASATGEEAVEIRQRVAENMDDLTRRVERAELLATDDNREFVSNAQQRIDRIDQEIQTLQSRAAALPLEDREEAAESVENLRTQASDVRQTLTSISNAAPQEIAEQRDDIADDLSALSGSVQRETLEIQADLPN